MMGEIEFKGWNVGLNDIGALNRSRETSKTRHLFERQANLVSASAKGNVAAYYNILVSVKQQLISGGFNVAVALSTVEKIFLKV